MHPRTNDSAARFVFRIGRIFPCGVATLALFLFTLSSSAAAAQSLHHASNAEKLKTAFTNLKAMPNSRSAQHHYLKVFPRTYKKFQAYFGPGGALADGNECDYIFALSALQGHHVAEVGGLLVQLSKDAEYEGNAPSCLHNVMA